MDLPQSEKEIFDYIQREHESVMVLHKDLNKDYIAHISSNISQKRTFYQNLSTLAAIIIGFTPFLFESDKVKQSLFLFFGVISLLIVIVIVINYLRSQIDEEGNKFKKQLDFYNNLLNPQMDKRRNYLTQLDYSQEAFRNFLKDMSENSVKQIDEIKKWDSERRSNTQKQRMDYAGEFFIFFFILGISLLIISFTSIRFGIFEGLAFVLSIIIITFFIPFYKAFIYLGYPIDFIKNNFERKKK